MLLQLMMQYHNPGFQGLINGVKTLDARTFYVNEFE